MDFERSVSLKCGKFLSNWATGSEELGATEFVRYNFLNITHIKEKFTQLYNVKRAWPGETPECL
jgi:hypothetical protein